MAARRDSTPRSQVESVDRYLRSLRLVDPDLAGSPEATLALVLARELDVAKNSATAKSMCAGQLAAVLKELRALSPAAANEDGLDELTRRRALRLARGAAAKA